MSRRIRSAPNVPGGVQIFRRMFTRLGCRGRPPHFLVEFHPYADLTLTIRLRQDTAFVRLSDLLRKAPLEIIEAAAAILLARLYRRKPPGEMIERYRQFSDQRSTRNRLLALRRRRARRAPGEPAGVHHDLGSMFDALNRRYFQSALPRPQLSWSSRAWRIQLGCFDPALRQIVLNRRLDSHEVPGYVLSYVLYHEMLHVKHPMRFARCRLQSHSAGFRREEKRFPHYDRARKWLTRFSGP